MTSNTAPDRDDGPVAGPVGRPVRPLVERLREAAQGEEFFGFDGLRDEPDALLTEAADEIDRLIKERDDYERQWLAERRAVEATISGGRYPDGQPAW